MHNDTILKDVVRLQYLIVKAGGMATKSLVEDMIMIRHDIDRYAAHDYTNEIERRNEKHFDTLYGGLRWIGDDEPLECDYPELQKVSFRVYT